MARPPIRLWRARRRGVRIDAELRSDRGRWTLFFLRNDRPLASLDCADERTARSRARATLRELELAGWIEHW